MTHPGTRTVLPRWRLAPDAWRWVRRLDERHVHALFRLRSARILPSSLRVRFLAMGLPEDVLDDTLERIHSPRQWPDAWIETAQRFLGDYRRQHSARHPREAAQARQLAAMSYHIAQLFGTTDQRTIRTCRAAAASLFTQALPYTAPDARRITIPWRNHRLPGYLQRPAGTRARVGLVVILNGTSTCKEESFSWAGTFLQAGLAVLTMDTPGSGEASGILAPDHDADDVLDGVFELLGRDPGLDLGQVSVVGVSLGGNLGVRCAVHDRRVMCVVAVTPPFDPARWIHRASPFVLAQLVQFGGGGEQDPYRIVDRYSLHDITPALRVPLLVFGAGRDLVVPSTEAQLLAARAGALGTLVWYPAGGHCLYEHIPAWTGEAATWISSVAAARAEELQVAGYADPASVAAIAREQLLAADIRHDVFDDEISSRSALPADDDWDDPADYARLIPPARNDQAGTDAP
jgi:dienelactone hydrolase